MVAYSLRLSSVLSFYSIGYVLDELVYKLKTELVSPMRYKINNDTGVPDATLMRQ